MIPLCYADANQTTKIKMISGTPEVKKHLEDLGFVVGTDVIVINSIDGNLIVNIRGSRIALDKKLALKIKV